MPAAVDYVEPKKADEIASQERRDRGKYIALAWDYYRGRHRRHLVVEPGETDDNVILNLCRKLVDSNVAMLVGNGVKFELTEGDVTEAEEYLERQWGGSLKQGRTQRKGILLTDIALNGFVSGHVFVKLVPQFASRSRPGARPTGVRIVNLDPSIVTVFWAENDIENVLWYAIQWSETNRQDIVNNGDGSWTIIDYTRRNGRARWEVVGDQVWPHEWAPIVDWKNLPNPNEYYGLSDLEDADLNDAVNFTVSNFGRILKHHAHPKTIGTGFTEDGIQASGIDDFWMIENENAKVWNLEMMSDLKSSLEFIELLRGAFFSIGKGVDIASMKDRLGQITNLGLRLLFKDALDRLELKRTLYGDGFIEINRRVLELGGFGPENVTKIVWSEPLPEDRTETVNAVKTELEMGVISKRTAASQLGHDWDEEQKRMAEENAESATEVSAGTTGDDDPDSGESGESEAGRDNV